MRGCLISLEVFATTDYNFDDGISQNQFANGGQYVSKYEDIDSWFDDDAKSSMSFIYVPSIIQLLGFILLILLCFKHEKLRKLTSLNMASPPVVNATDVDTSSNTGIFIWEQTNAYNYLGR